MQLRTHFLAWLVLAHVLGASASGQARLLFSVSWQGPTFGSPDPFTGSLISAGDLLEPSGVDPLPVTLPVSGPRIHQSFSGAGLGFAELCDGEKARPECSLEVDALSRGGDSPFLPQTSIQPGDILFTVDEFARGAGTGPDPSPFSEAPGGDVAADTFTNLLFLSPGPIAPMMGLSVGVIDGNGRSSPSGHSYPGTGLEEPNLPFPGDVDGGDLQDAVDLVETTIPIGPVYYLSLDSAFMDPLEQKPGLGSAVRAGFHGGDILVAPGPGGPTLWASANELGLDRVAGPDSDDLDALILFENGSGVYEAPSAPYDWVTGGTDMVVFSVRRGSAVIGEPDSIFGLPIEPGDLLIPAPSSSASALPGIFVPAEALGLATARSGAVAHGDDVTAADSLLGTVFDCDADGVEDAIAIALGAAADVNGNGVPDTCECATVGTEFCFCPAPLAPCGNPIPSAGCGNVAGTGARISGCGSASVSLDDLVLTTRGMVPATFAVTFMGNSSVTPEVAGNGVRCAGGALFRFPPFSTGAGTGSSGPGLVAETLAVNAMAGQITAGATWNFQTFYRDIGGACGASFAMSSAVAVSFTP